PQHAPERVGIGRAARKAAANADDGDRLALGPLLRLELRFHLLEREQRALERRQRFKTIRLARLAHRERFPNFSSSSASASASLNCSRRSAAADRSTSAGLAAGSGAALSPSA